MGDDVILQLVNYQFHSNIPSNICKYIKTLLHHICTGNNNNKNKHINIIIQGIPSTAPTPIFYNTIITGKIYCKICTHIRNTFTN